MKKIATKKFLKIALRQDIERFEHPKITNPYQHSEPGMGQDSGGVSYRVRAGDEYGGSASMGGSTAREGYPRDFKQNDDLDIQRKRNIPASDHMFIRDNDESMVGTGTGADDQRFTDYRDRIPTDQDIFGPNPPRIQDMHTMKEKRKRNSNIFDRLQNRVKGAYYG